MESTLIHRTLAALHSIQPTTRAMFGGIGIFGQGTMFALIANDTLYIKSHPETDDFFKMWRMKPYIYQKKNFPVTSKYYATPTCWWDDLTCLEQVAQKALRLGQQEKQQKLTALPTRLKDLPNLRFANERMLRKVGIQTVAELRETGAIHAYQALKKQQKETLQPTLILALEGAIQGTHWSVIPSKRRKELLNACL
jgi:DNA transformation protein